MSDKKIKVPDGMLKAGKAAFYSSYATGSRAEEGTRLVLEAALRWLSEHPIAPTDAFLEEMLNRDFFSGENWTDPQVFAFCVEWVRRMFHADPEVPEAVKDLLCAGTDTVKEACFLPDIYNERILEAYRRGKKHSS